MAKDLKLILGCWKRYYGKEYTHIDLKKLPNVDIVSDVRRLPLEDNSASYIYASHVLEYFDRQIGIDVLREWHRVLKPNGILRVAVPDFEALSDLYSNKRLPLNNILGPVFGRMDCNGEKIFHKTTYDYLALERSLKEADFKYIGRYDWRHTDHADIDDHSQSYIPHMDKQNGRLISLNVEARK